MPHAKHSSLIKRHETKGEVETRAARERAMEAHKALPMSAPAALGGSALAQRTWRRVVRDLKRLERQLANYLDLDLLQDYCIVVAQAEELDTLRAEMISIVEQAGVMDVQSVCAIDGRVDRKRALLLTLRKSLYMTPKSRGGLAPEVKQEIPPDDLTLLLDEAV